MDELGQADDDCRVLLRKLRRGLGQIAQSHLVV